MAAEFEFERFFSSQAYFEERYRRLGRRLAYAATTQAEYESWAAELRGRLRAVTGLDTMVHCDLQPRVTEVVDEGDYTRERIELQTEPGVIMPVYALIPKGRRGPLRVVLAPHGHASGGKLAPAGRTDLPAVKATIEQHNYAYGVQLARRGFAVFCPDARGFGERREPAHQHRPASFMHGSCRELNNMAIPLGQTVTGMWTWDLMRLVDYVQSRPDCDAVRITCAGLSGGGLQTLWLAALDTRIRAAVVSGYFYGYLDSLLKLNGNCSCNYVPGLWSLVDMGDIAALIAPRPLLIETGDRDSLNGERGVTNAGEQVGITRQAYALLGAPDEIVHHVFAGEHRWDGTRAVPWLAERMGAH